MVNKIIIDAILKLPNTAKHLDELHFFQTNESNPDMLQTIKIPKNIN